MQFRLYQILSAVLLYATTMTVCKLLTSPNFILWLAALNALLVGVGFYHGLQQSKHIPSEHVWVQQFVFLAGLLTPYLTPVFAGGTIAFVGSFFREESISFRATTLIITIVSTGIMAFAGYLLYRYAPRPAPKTDDALRKIFYD